VRAAFGHAPAIQDHDLVRLVQAVQVMGDQQDRVPGRRGQQVCGQGAAVVRIQVRGRLLPVPGLDRPVPFWMSWSAA
jgi:hypothetical protein